LPGRLRASIGYGGEPVACICDLLDANLAPSTTTKTYDILSS